MIGTNIYKHRKQRGLTLSDLAEQAQLSKSYLSNIERNLNQNPSIQIVERIANVLRVDFRILLGIDTVNLEVLDDEWIRFINELRESGVEKEQLHEYKMVLEFAKWKKESCNE